jgi:hypothetical protein
MPLEWSGPVLFECFDPDGMLVAQVELAKSRKHWEAYDLSMEKSRRIGDTFPTHGAAMHAVNEHFAALTKLDEGPAIGAEQQDAA